MQTHAVGLLHTIATAFANFFVNHQSLGGLSLNATRPFPTLFGSALLIVNDGADARNLFHLSQSSFQLQPISSLSVRCQVHLRIVVQELSQHHSFHHAFSRQFSGERRNGKLPFGFLSTSHGHCGVVKNFVSDVGTTGNGGVDRQLTRVCQRAIAHILENMVLIHKAMHANPHGPFTAHLGRKVVTTVHRMQHYTHAAASNTAACNLPWQ